MATHFLMVFENGAQKARSSATNTFDFQSIKIGTSLLTISESSGKLNFNNVVITGVSDGVGASDLVNKGQLDTKLSASEVGVSVASLSGGKVPEAQLPSPVKEYANLAAFPGTGVAGQLYLAQDTNKIFHWTGSVYAEVAPAASQAVDSVNGETGAVELDAADIPFASAQTGLTGATNVLTGVEAVQQNLNTVESNLSADINSLDLRVDQTESDIGAIQTAASLLSGRVDATESNITSLQTATGDLSTDIGNVAQDLADHESSNSAHQASDITFDGSSPADMTATNVQDAVVEVKGLVEAEVTRATNAETVLQNAINALGMNLQWRPGAFLATEDAGLAAATEGTVLSSLLPFSDDDAPELVIGDFATGQYLLSKSGATSKIFEVYDDAGTLKLTLTGIAALAAGDVLLVRNDLPDSPDSQEGLAIYSFNGSDIIKVGDMDWSLATGIDLSGAFSSTTGTVAAGDSVELAIAKLTGNLAAAAAAAAAAANSTLSNLGATAINASLIPNATGLSLGANSTTATMWDSVHVRNTVRLYSSAGGDKLHITGNGSTAMPSGVNMVPYLVSYETGSSLNFGMVTIGTSGATPSQSIRIETGNNSGTAVSGSITLKTGTAAGSTRGNIILDGETIQVKADVVGDGVVTRHLGASGTPFGNLHLNSSLYLRNNGSDSMELTGSSFGNMPSGVSAMPRLFSGANNAGSVTPFGIYTGNSSGATASQTMRFETGNQTGSGNSGAIVLKTGTAAGGTRGNITLDANQVTLTANQINFSGSFVPTTSNLEIGTSGQPLGQVYSKVLAMSAGELKMHSGAATVGGQSFVLNDMYLKADTDLAIATNNSSSTKKVVVATGNATSGNSGNLYLATGTATGTRGKVVLDGLEVDVSSKKIVNLADPTPGSQEAATAAYVDAAISAAGGASAAGVTGSIQFSDGAGGFSSDDTKLFWNDAEDQLMIGTDTFANNAPSLVVMNRPGHGESASFTDGTRIMDIWLDPTYGSIGTKTNHDMVVYSNDAAGAWLEMKADGTFMKMNNTGALLPAVDGGTNLGSASLKYSQLHVDNVMDGSAVVVDVLNQQLNDSSGAVGSINWDQRVLYDNTGSPQISWPNPDEVDFNGNDLVSGGKSHFSEMSVGNHTPMYGTNPGDEPIAKIVGQQASVDPDRGILAVMDNRALAANVGADITLGGTYNSSGALTMFGQMRAFKENATDGAYGGGLEFKTRMNSMSIATAMRLMPDGSMDLMSHNILNAVEIRGASAEDVLILGANNAVVNGNGSSVILTGGNTDTTANNRFGGNIELIGGNATGLTGNSKGGSIFLTAGNASGTGTRGSIDLDAEQVNVYSKMDMGGFGIESLLDPVSAQDAATKNYTDTTFVPLSDAYLDLQNDNAGTINQRQIVYIKPNGAVDLADADMASMGDYALGVVKDPTIATTASGNITVKYGEMIGGFSSLTPGATYYLSATAGDITATAPSSGTVYKVGRAVNSTVLRFEPDFIIEIL